MGQASPHRRGYIDWLRGVAVLIMIEGHSLDAWLHPADRDGWLHGLGVMVAGIGGPLFLFLAGVAVVLAVSARTRKTGDPGAAARSVQRRGWEIFGLAFLFRLQSRLLSGGTWYGLLKVDMLNIMGPSIALAAAVGGWVRGPRLRLWIFGALTVGVAMVTPLVRRSSWLMVLPDPLEGYLRPIPGLTNFTFFPWGGFVLAGACAGVWLDRAREPEDERRLNGWFLVAGLALIAGGYGASWLPPLYANASFWTSSPTYFFMRVGILAAGLPLAYAWSRRPTARRWSPLQQLGRTSLFVYWIHVEMAYGQVAAPLHRGLMLDEWALAFVAFTAVLLVLSLAKDAVVSSPWVRARRSRADAARSRSESSPSGSRARSS